MSEVVPFLKAVEPEPPEPKVGELISIYLETRDTKEALARKHKEALKAYTDVMALIEGKLLEHLQAAGGQSFSNNVGTAYLTRKRSATISDMVEFRGYVIENRAWDMVDWRANAVSVSDFLAENEQLPPGLNFSVTTSVNVQKK